MSYKSEKLGLLAVVYSSVNSEVESFEEQNIGADLAYLFGAILNDAYVEWESDRPFVKILKKIFKPEEYVWDFVVVHDHSSPKIID